MNTNRDLNRTLGRTPRKSFARPVWPLACGAVCLGLGGCIAVGGTSHRAAPATDGQQLIDLKRAADEGAISQAEFESMKQRIIDDTGSKS
jgi:hypothetical protein